MRMKKILILFLGFSILLPNASFAVENGDDASGNPFVVPISANYNSTQTIRCSGTLIAPTIVVTAGHCVLDSNGLVSQTVYVGAPGSNMQNVMSGALASSIEITSSFSNTGGKVTNDDLAFIVLSQPQKLLLPIRLASEAELNQFKNSASALKAIGYGYYSDSGIETITSPKSFTGLFSSMNTALPNSAYMSSTTADSCAGDSGSPVITTSANSVILVGVLTGGLTSNKCSKKYTDGLYYSSFTLVSRYANLAFAAASSSISALNSQVESQNQDSNDLSSQVDDLTAKLTAATDQIAQLQDAIKKLQAKLPSTITCQKGKTTQKVSGISPKCPSGYAQKQ